VPTLTTSDGLPTPPPTATQHEPELRGFLELEYSLPQLTIQPGFMPHTSLIPALHFFMAGSALSATSMFPNVPVIHRVIAAKHMCLLSDAAVFSSLQ
jgi:hypothetical protein